MSSYMQLHSCLAYQHTRHSRIPLRAQQVQVFTPLKPSNWPSTAGPSRPCKTAQHASRLSHELDSVDKDCYRQQHIHIPPTHISSSNDAIRREAQDTVHMVTGFSDKCERPGSFRRNQ